MNYYTEIERIRELLKAAQDGATDKECSDLAEDMNILRRSFKGTGAEPNTFIEWMHASWNIGFNPMPHYRTFVGKEPIGWERLRRAAWAICELYN